MTLPGVFSDVVETLKGMFKRTKSTRNEGQSSEGNNDEGTEVRTHMVTMEKEIHDLRKEIKNIQINQAIVNTIAHDNQRPSNEQSRLSRRDIDTSTRLESPNVYRGETRDMRAAQSDIDSQMQLCEHRIPSNQHTHFPSLAFPIYSSGHSRSSSKVALRRSALNSSQDNIANFSQHTSRNDVSWRSRRRENVTTRTDVIDQAHVNAPSPPQRSMLFAQNFHGDTVDRFHAWDPVFPHENNIQPELVDTNNAVRDPSSRPHGLLVSGSRKAYQPHDIIPRSNSSTLAQDTLSTASVAVPRVTRSSGASGRGSVQTLAKKYESLNRDQNK